MDDVYVLMQAGTVEKSNVDRFSAESRS